MTYAGQLLIDLFALSLDSKRPNNNANIISQRSANILKRYYNFEENTFDNLADIAKDLNLSRERIRQIHHNSLQKIKTAGNTLPDNHFCSKLIKHVNESITKTEGQSIHHKIINFWHYNLPEYPGKIVIRLISHLFHIKGEFAIDTLKKFSKWEVANAKEICKKEYGFFKKEKEFIKTIEEQNNLLKETIWFEKVIKWGDFVKLNFSPKRKVNQNSEFRSGLFESKKCNSFVQYESNLELNFIMQLEKFPKVKYYTEQPVKIEYRSKNLTKEYTPDFAILLDSDEIILVEIKNFQGMVDARVHNKIEAMIDYCKENGLGLLLTNGKESINRILNHKHNREFEKELDNRLNERNNRIIYLNEMQEIQDRFSASRIDLYSIVLKNNWSLYPYYFKLSKRNPYQKFRNTMIKFI